MTTAPGLESITVTRWLWDRLTTDPDLQVIAGSAVALDQRVWEGTAPEDAPGDWWITWTIGVPRDIRVVGMIQVMAAVPVTVKVTGQTEAYEDILPQYARVLALLDAQANATVAGYPGLVLTAERRESLQMPERTNGVEYRHLGATFDVHAQ